MMAVKVVGVVMMGWCEMLRDSLGIESGMSVGWAEGGKETGFGWKGLGEFIPSLVIVQSCCSSS
jgi:hypothetical protein